MQSNVAHPMKLTVSPAVSRQLMDGIPNERCRAAALNNWNVSSEGFVDEESVNWLFCWGKTGMGSEATAEEARRVFDKILPISFNRYDQQVEHEYARSHRYPRARQR